MLLGSFLRPKRPPSVYSQMMLDISFEQLRHDWAVEGPCLKPSFVLACTWCLQGFERLLKP